MARKKKDNIEETIEEPIEADIESDEDEEEVTEDSIDDELEESEEDDYDDDNDDEDDDESNYELNPVKNTMSDTTRYIIISIITVVLLALIIVLISTGNKDNGANKNSNTPATSNERDTSTEALKEFYEQFDSKDLNVIYFASSSCGYCSLEKPIIEQISKDYEMDYYAIDASLLSKDEINEMASALGIRGATPTTVIVKEGKVIAKNEGYLDGKPYVEFFAENGVLDKDATYKQEDNLVLIDYNKFKEIAKKDETSLIFLDTSACQDCITVRSLLSKLAEKNGFKVNYLSAANLSQDDVNNLIKTDLKEMKYDDKTYQDEGQIKIPLLLVIKDNKIKDYVLESTKESDYTNVLKKYGFIK